METLGTGSFPEKFEPEREEVQRLLCSLLLPTPRKANEPARSQTPPPPPVDNSLGGEILDDAWNPLSGGLMPVIYVHGEYH